MAYGKTWTGLIKQGLIKQGLIKHGLIGEESFLTRPKIHQERYYVYVDSVLNARLAILEFLNQKYVSRTTSSISCIVSLVSLARFVLLPRAYNAD